MAILGFTDPAFPAGKPTLPGATATTDADSGQLDINLKPISPVSTHQNAGNIVIELSDDAKQWLRDLREGNADSTPPEYLQSQSGSFNSFEYDPAAQADKTSDVQSLTATSATASAATAAYGQVASLDVTNDITTTSRDTQDEQEFPPEPGEQADLSPVPGDPEATIEKAEDVRVEALRPPPDLTLAAEAQQVKRSAERRLQADVSSSSDAPTVDVNTATSAYRSPQAAPAGASLATA